MKTNGHEIVRVGQEVKYRGNFGSGQIRTAKLEEIELCEDEHEKYGTPVEEVSVHELYKCVLDLSDGYWAYGYQIVEIL
jgi:hypothetical protein